MRVPAALAIWETFGKVGECRVPNYRCGIADVGEARPVLTRSTVYFASSRTI
jgi:hypothetical protein